jgi:hypothetical protein
MVDIALETPIEIDLTPNPGRVRFETVEDVEKWIIPR